MSGALIFDTKVKRSYGKSLQKTHLRGISVEFS